MGTQGTSNSLTSLPSNLLNHLNPTLNLNVNLLKLKWEGGEGEEEGEKGGELEPTLSQAVPTALPARPPPGQQEGRARQPTEASKKSLDHDRATSFLE